MNHPLAAAVIALFVSPLIIATTGGAFALLFGYSTKHAAIQVCVYFTVLFVAASTDLARELPHRRSNPGVNAGIILRAIGITLLPFALVAVWIAFALAYKSEVHLNGLVFPFATGVFLGRAAIECHFLQRPSNVDRFPIETIHFSDDDFG